MDLVKHFFSTLQRLIPRAKTLVLGVSGGSDSVALLRLFFPESHAMNENVNPNLLQEPHFQKLQVELGIDISIKTVVVAHLDHALRDTSAKDAIFVKILCKNLRVPFYSERLEVANIAREKKWNLEDAARRFRYSFLTKVAKDLKADAILTAHTQDDQAETVLMQLIRGTAFLGGIRERQDRLIRPLLNVSRQDLQHYLSSLGQDYRVDESNLDTQRTRSWVRHKVIPILEQRYPQIKSALAQLASIQQDHKVHFDAIAGIFSKNQEKVDTNTLQKHDLASQRHIIATLAPGIDYQHIEAIREALGSKTPVRFSLPDQRIARIAYAKLSILDTKTTELKTNLPFEHLEKTWKTSIAQNVDFKKLESFDNLVLRHRQAGDTIKLSSGTKKVSDLLIDLKIPREERDTIPMLASGKEVLWVQDVATDIRVRKNLENPDITYMKQALILAKEAIQHGDLPVGCVIVKDDQIIANALNQTEVGKSPFAHAEVLAMQQAAQHLGDWRLEGCTLYVTLEPCPMCFGAILQAHVSKVVYGATNTRDGALGTVLDMQNAPWKRKVEIKGKVLEKECSKVLSDFFKLKRSLEVKE